MSNTLDLSQPSTLHKGYSMTDAKMIRLEKTLLALWLIANLIIGALTVREYGMSIDEPNNYRYADDTLNAYPSFFGMLYEPNYDSSYDGHGPAFMTIVGIFIRMIQSVFPNVFAPDLWHFSYFITFQLTGLCLYGLAKRWFSMSTAWSILILFSTQPVLIGHSFINPKDIPFMFFLTLSVVWGFRMVDAREASESFGSLEKPTRTIAHKFQEADPARRRKFINFFVAALAITLALIVFSRQVNSLLEQVVIFFYNAESESWAGRFFGSVASQNIPAADYVTKALKLLQRAERVLLVGSLFFFLTYFGLLINNTSLSAFLRNTWMQRNKLLESLGNWRKSVSGPVHSGSLKTWLAEFFRALRDPHTILAGVALGLAAGIRAIGPLAGVVVVLYLFAKTRSKRFTAWRTAIAYFVVAGIMTYIAWPRLWDAPVTRYLEGLGLISNFPHFPGQVLFNGHLYGPSDLPRSYLPVLLSIQFTEPLVLGIYAGLGIFIWRLLRNRLRTDLLLYISLGFGLPLLGLILLQSPLYHNFRQVLFIIPAMVMLAAFPLEFLFNKMTQTWVRIMLIAAIALPGAYSTVKLYPYEYVYYNSLVGGPAGAVYRYEMDYWRISLRQVALELNKVAPPGSLIVVTRSAGLLARYTRPDLVVDKPINSILDLDSGYDYIVHVTRGKSGDLYPEVNSLIVIERDGAVLATAKYVRDVSEK
jgi:4-amino-4-deoxy-L-arabinose transferase-like glycosyltransferase